MASKFSTEDGLRGEMRNSGKTAADLDAARRRNTAYEYLCHLEEARKWLEACLKEELPSASEIEEALRNGVILAKLAIFFAPEVVKQKHVYDMTEEIFQERGLVFRHTDNISQWLKAMRTIKFPEIFYPEVTDIYDKKNMPRTIYCVHALSRYLYHLGIAPEMENLQGIAQFTEEEISAMDEALSKAGVQMPHFGKIGGVLAKELGVDEAAMHAAILAINQALENHEPTEELTKKLNHPAAGLQRIERELTERYRAPLEAARNQKVAAADLVPPAAEAGTPDQGEQDIYDINLTKEEIQRQINVVNDAVAQERYLADVGGALDLVNGGIDNANADQLYKGLTHPALEIPAVDETLKAEYLQHLTATKQAGGNQPLTKDAVQAGVAEANATAASLRALADALNADDSQATFAALQAARDVIGCEALNPAAAGFYHEALKKAGGNLTAEQVCEIVASCNRLAEALDSVNRAIDGEDSEATLKALQNPVLGLTDVDDAGAFQYHTQLQEAKKAVGRNLTLKELQEQITAANVAAEENAKHAAALFAINEAARAGKVDETYDALTDPASRVSNIHENAKERYQQSLAAALKVKDDAAGGVANRWKKFKTDDGRVYYYNKETKQTQWVPPADLSDSHLQLEEIQAVIEQANADQTRAEMFQAREGDIVHLQALIRGALVRKRFTERMRFLRDNEEAAVKIQAAFRGARQRKQFKDRLDFLNAQTAAAIKIQAGYKGWKARQQYENLTKVSDPPLQTVRKFLHLLDQSDTDFKEELLLNETKQKVISQIKQNHRLEQDVNEMDIKIGLLVKNRIELEDVAKVSKQMKKRRARGQGEAGSRTNLDPSGAGLKSLTKDARERLESYQHLFYLLQTNPAYLARLVFMDSPLERWSPHKTATFLNHVIQSTYNYASNPRENYLLLKLFRTACHLEVTEKVTQLKEFITGNPTFVKLVVNHYRGKGRGESYLLATLGPLVKELIDDDTVDFNTDPTDVYKRWVMKTETETGERSTLPYEVERDAALSHEPVRKILDTNVRNVLRYAQRFLDSIIESMSELPYGIRYICMAARQDLREKFPDAPDEEIVKVLGNIIFFRFISPAIIAPENFGALDNLGIQLDVMQRRNLASIAKILQFAAAGQQFASDEGHMAQFNAFMGEAWFRFKDYFERASVVPSSEEYFNVDEYSDVTMVSRPMIYISPAEIYYTHEMLLKNVEEIATDKEDPLREILQDLGELGSEEEVLGEEGSPQLAASKTEISLTLNNKFEVPEDEDTSTKALFLRTKRMVIHVIRCQSGKNLKEILETPASPEETEEYVNHAARLKTDASRLAKEGVPEASLRAMIADDSASLDDVKQRILANLQQLETEGICKSSDNYQDILNSIAQDIRNQRIYRRERKAELRKLQTTSVELQRKRSFFGEQLESYDQYVSKCMEQMSKGKGRKHRGITSFFSRSKDKETTEGGQYMGSYKYSAKQLKDKGVLLSVDGVSDSQLKLVNLEISSKEVGLFQISASLLGVKKEEELVFQDLLQKQYEGVPTMRMFDLCTVNVNLLVFLINKKFFNK